jgi:hypothetical protein
MEFVEFDDNGFTLKRDWLPFLKPRIVRNVLWENIREIDVCMWDCFTCHNVGLLFDDGAKKLVSVDENRKGYDGFTKYVKERFDGFNCNNFENIEMMFPSDISFPCWSREKTIGDLEVKREDNKILWKDSREVFLEWED